GPGTHAMPSVPPEPSHQGLPGLEEIDDAPPATPADSAPGPALGFEAASPAAATPAPLSPIVSEAPAAAATEGSAQSARFSLPPSLTSRVAKPSDLPAALSTRWDEVLTAAERMDVQTYYDMLGVSSTASEKEINAAYFAQVKTWHPDRLPQELEALRGHAETVFHHLTEAQKTLLDPRLSARYRKAVQDGGGTPADERKLAKVLDAAMTFQKAEVMLRRKNWAEAMPLIDEALSLRPSEPDYLAAKAEVLLRRKGAEGLHLKQLRELLMRALQAAPDHERALMVKAELATRRNDHTEAMRLYEQVAERYPKNIDAVRQVRIARMRSGGERSGSQDAEDTGSGLLGKLFGRKKK
ncbi:MAG: DnaJ domain-containing protein, partial [Myxococcota bacterium]